MNKKLTWIIVASIALAGCSTSVRSEPTPTPMTKTVEVPGPTQTVEVQIENTACIAALDAADAMMLEGGKALESAGTVIGEYFPQALEAAAAWDVDTLEQITDLIIAENESLDAEEFSALTDDYVAKSERCRARS